MAVIYARVRRLQYHYRHRYLGHTHNCPLLAAGDNLRVLPMADNKVFDTGFPGPSPTSQEIDSLPSRIAQSSGVRDAAVKRGQAMAEQALAAPMAVADKTVDMMLSPLNQTLSDAGTVAAQTVIQGQAATVKALQSPLSTALKYGYQSHGTPVLNPVLPVRKKRAAKASSSSAVAAIPAGQFILPQQQIITEYGVIIDCSSKQIAAVPGVIGAWSQPGWSVPAGWILLGYYQKTPDDMLIWLRQNGLSLLQQSIASGRC